MLVPFYCGVKDTVYVCGMINRLIGGNFADRSSIVPYYVFSVSFVVYEQSGKNMKRTDKDNHKDEKT